MGYQRFVDVSTPKLSLTGPGTISKIAPIVMSTIVITTTITVDPHTHFALTFSCE